MDILVSTLYDVLNSLPNNLTEISYKTRITYSHLSAKTIPLLEKHGIIKIEETGRSKRIELSEKGNRLKESLDNVM